MFFGKKYAWLQMVMWLGIDQWAWTMNIWHIIKQSTHSTEQCPSLESHDSLVHVCITVLKLPSLFTARLFWTFHTKSHNMRALVIQSHHDHHFSHLLVFMKKNELLWVPVSSSGYFREKILSTAHHFNMGAHIGICAPLVPP